MRDFGIVCSRCIESTRSLDEHSTKCNVHFDAQSMKAIFQCYTCGNREVMKLDIFVTTPSEKQYELALEKRKIELALEEAIVLDQREALLN